MTDTELPAREKAEATPEQKAERALNRLVGRALCRNEGAGGAEMKTRWNEGRTQYVGQARKLVRALTKEGVTLTIASKVADADDDSDDSSEV